MGIGRHVSARARRRRYRGHLARGRAPGRALHCSYRDSSQRRPRNSAQHEGGRGHLGRRHARDGRLRVLPQVKEEIPDLPVILMTAYYYDKDHIIKRSRLRGVEGAIFKKPVNPEKLRAMLRQWRQKAANEKPKRKLPR